MYENPDNPKPKHLTRLDAEVTADKAGITGTQGPLADVHATVAEVTAPALIGGSDEVKPDAAEASPTEVYLGHQAIEHATERTQAE